MAFRHPYALALGLAALLLATGCGGHPEEFLTVRGPVSQSEAIREAARSWERQGNGPVRVTLGATSRMARQIQQGAPTDVVVTANPDWMATLVQSGHVDPASRQELAHGRLVHVTAPTATTRPRQPRDLTHTTGRIAVAGASVPLGRYARAALQHHQLLDRLEPHLVSLPNARAVLAACAAGRVEGAIVYANDAAREPKVHLSFVFPHASHPPIRYLGAIPIASTHPGRARAFLAHLAARLSAPHQEENQPSPVDVSSVLRVTILVAATAVALLIVPGILLGWLLARSEFPGKTLISALIHLPLVLPPVVTGYLLLLALGPNSTLGSWIEQATGLRFAFSFGAATLAAAVVGLPFLVTSVRLAIEGIDPRYEGLSRTLGAGRLATFWRVTLPLARPGILAGCVLAFARALGEFGATAVLAGDVAGETRTISLAVYALLDDPGGEGAAALLVLCAILISISALALHEFLARRQKRQLHRGTP